MKKIIDMNGNEVKVGSVVLKAAKNTNTAKLRKCVVVDITEEQPKYAGYPPYTRVKIRSICIRKSYRTGKEQARMGVLDSRSWHNDDKSNTMQINALVVDKSVLTEKELDFASKKFGI